MNKIERFVFIRLLNKQHIILYKTKMCHTLFFISPFNVFPSKMKNWDKFFIYFLLMLCVVCPVQSELVFNLDMPERCDFFFKAIMTSKVIFLHSIGLKRKLFQISVWRTIFPSVSSWKMFLVKSCRNFVW
jgi:hypothetical protein